LSQEEAKATADLYSLEYAKHRRAISGSEDLLKYLKPLVTTGIITDGLTKFQTEKIRVCEVEGLIDFVVTSEEVGCTKPSREIFEEALRRASTKPAETVYVGNSWDSDIMPAHELGIKTVWLNRYGLKCPNSMITTEIHSYAELNYQEFFL
jgi:putative hydrolase of the HAD superfamily